METTTPEKSHQMSEMARWLIILAGIAIWISYMAFNSWNERGALADNSEGIKCLIAEMQLHREGNIHQDNLILAATGQTTTTMAHDLRPLDVDPGLRQHCRDFLDPNNTTTTGDD